MWLKSIAIAEDVGDSSNMRTTYVEDNDNRVKNKVNQPGI